MVSSVYFAAALFSTRETLFNRELVRQIKVCARRELRVFLPQEDGFEFSSLGNELARRLPAEQVAMAVNTIIYTLDMGGFLSQSDAVVAVLDEPLDEGVLVEIGYARRLNVPVLGIRTDRRVPFGLPGDALGGIHFFAAYQCSHFIRAPVVAEIDQLQGLARAVVAWLDTLRATARGAGDAALDRAARQLLKDVDIASGSLRSPAVLARIVGNYLERPELFAVLAPRTEALVPA